MKGEGRKGCNAQCEEMHKGMDFSATPSLVRTPVFIFSRISLHGMIYNQSTTMNQHQSAIYFL
jgi:hypothetical protein